MFVRRRNGTSGKIGGCASARFAKAAGARARAVRSAKRNERAARRSRAAAADRLRRSAARVRAPPISAEVAERAESALPPNSAALVGVRYKSGWEKAAVSNFYCSSPLWKRFFPLAHLCGGLSGSAKPNFRGFLSPRLLSHLAKRRVFRTCVYAREARTRGRRRGCRRAAHPLAGFARFVQRNCFAIPPRRACAPLFGSVCKKIRLSEKPERRIMLYSATIKIYTKIEYNLCIY